MGEGMRRKTLSTRVPDEWLAEIDALVERKFPGRTRSDWLFGVVEHELTRQREGQSDATRLDQLLANDEKIFTILDGIYTAVQNK